MTPRFELVVALFLAAIGFVITAPIAALWVMRHDDEPEL